MLSVSDDLTPGGSEAAPDTLLAARAGGISDDILVETIDDDGSPLGDGTASAFADVDVINPGEIRFSVTGFGDDFFEGAHTEEDIYDLQLSVSGTYSADFNNDGQVDGFDLTDPATGWQARYGINLDGADFLAWQQQFGFGVGTTAVPEPTTLALLFLFIGHWSFGHRAFFSS